MEVRSSTNPDYSPSAAEQAHQHAADMVLPAEEHG
jgi:hypothetical protein